jgi:hypothetical protein
MGSWLDIASEEQENDDDEPLTIKYLMNSVSYFNLAC